MIKLGMNAYQVAALAVQLDRHAAAIWSSIGTIESLVNRAVQEWHGPDSQAFASSWHGHHKPAMERAHDVIAGLARSARNHVAGQEQVSAAAEAHLPARSGRILDGPAADGGPTLPGLPNPLGVSPFPLTDF